MKVQKAVVKNEHIHFVCLPTNFNLFESFSNFHEDLVGIKAHAVGWGRNSPEQTILVESKTTRNIELLTFSILSQKVNITKNSASYKNFIVGYL